MSNITEQYKNWLSEVKSVLLSLNILAYKDNKPYRASLFKKDLILDENSWYGYFEAKMTPRQAVKEDLELPWVEYKKRNILF
jgi:hypothetical protein